MDSPRLFRFPPLPPRAFEFALVLRLLFCAGGPCDSCRRGAPTDDADVEDVTEEVPLLAPLGKLGRSEAGRLLLSEFGLDAAVVDPSCSPCSPVPLPSSSTPKILSRARRYSSSRSLSVFGPFEPDWLDADVFDPAGVEAPEEAGLNPCDVGEGRLRIRKAADVGRAGTFDGTTGMAAVPDMFLT